MSGLRSMMMILALCPAACADMVTPEQLDDKLRSLQQAMEARHRSLEQELRLGWANALCRDEVRQLLYRVRRECGKNECVSRRIATAVTEIDPMHRGFFATMMSSQRHEVLYLADRAPVLDVNQRDRLRALVEPPWLPTTSFLVVSNLPPQGKRKDQGMTGDEKAALRRGEIVMGDMQALKFDGPAAITSDRIIHWIFSFSIKKGEVIRVDDYPPPPGRDLKYSVWVFRVDCAPEDPRQAAPLPGLRVP